MPKYILFAFLALFHISVIAQVVKLPHCAENTNPQGLVFVSTLDGQVSAVDWTGNLRWQVDTGPGSLLISNIHKLELTNNGQWIRIIPALSGSLYKFDGETIDAIPISAGILLTSSIRYSDDLVIAGGLEVRKYGVELNSGSAIYECSLQGCQNKTEHQNEAEDVVVIERSTYTVYAVEPRTGTERWNFSVGQHSLKIPHMSCMDSINLNQIDFNVTAVLPDGLLIAHNPDTKEIMWQYKFNSPIVAVWKWNGRKLKPVNLFSPVLPTSSVPFSPVLYVGMHNKQLYIHESIEMQHALEIRAHPKTDVIESQSLAKIPWKPVPASNVALMALDESDDSTALSVLYGSEYVNGNGYYLYSATDIERENKLLCENNDTLNIAISKDVDEEIEFVGTMWYWWKEILVISVTTAIVFNFMYNSRFWTLMRPELPEIIVVERPAEVPPQQTPIAIPNRSHSESFDSQYISRYCSDFEEVSCLGKGGFGVVFQVKKKFDECDYAVKRIMLHNEQKARERVMREVKALAKLDHVNIVRYYNAWLESPPPDWQKEHDQNLLGDFSSSYAMDMSSRKRSVSVAIDIPDISNCIEALDLSANTLTSSHSREPSDSFIVFEKSSNDQIEEDEVSSPTASSGTSEHLKKKMNWRQPSRRPHSLDITSRGSVAPPAPLFLYIQMQLCHKDSLREWLSTRKDRNFEEILNIFKQILGAVEYVHLQGLIHRDLKPSNIFFSLQGEVKVGDFGLVKGMQDGIAIDFNTSSPVFPRGHTNAVGTRLYMSPEQFDGKNYNYKIDIYSLGVILFELLVPFGTEMERHIHLTNLRKNCFPDGFVDKYPNEHKLLNLMLAHNHKERPTTIGIRARRPFEHNDATHSIYQFKLPLTIRSKNLETEFSKV